MTERAFRVEASDRERSGDVGSTRSRQLELRVQLRPQIIPTDCGDRSGDDGAYSLLDLGAELVIGEIRVGIGRIEIQRSWHASLISHSRVLQNREVDETEKRLRLSALPPTISYGSSSTMLI
jgi:hypothetical protein